MKTFTKLQIAEQQLETALQLHLDDADYVSAITLAGASEEILGKLLEKEGKTPALKSFVQTCVEAGQLVYGEAWDEKLFVSMANHFRDRLKHLSDGEPVTVCAAVSLDMLDRAVSNYFALTGQETHRMKRLLEEASAL